MRALIVDDERTVRVLLSRILTRDYGCTVVEAANGIEALDQLSRQRFDFVLLDLLMPMMTGFETLEVIRADESLRDLPVLVMSTVREEAQVRAAIRLGIGTYMTKPLRPADVGERLARFLSAVGYRVTTSQAERALEGVSPGVRVLVVEGRPERRMMMVDALGRDYTVESAESGAQGLRQALLAAPALIVLGSDLGPVSARTFIAKLRAIPSLVAVPVVGASDDVELGEAAAESELSIGAIDDLGGWRRRFDDLVNQAAGGPTRSSPRMTDDEAAAVARLP